MLCDWEIEALARAGMIEPFEAAQVRKGVSYGLSSAGYDMRLAPEFKILIPHDGDYLDPKNPSAAKWVTIREDDYLDIPPHGFVLGRSVEYWRIPPNVVGTVLGKSTYARNALFANVTPLEPDWEGYLTIELTNGAPVPSRVYVGEGICQAQFSFISIPKVSYKDRAGKYQNQPAMPVLAKV